MNPACLRSALAGWLLAVCLPAGLGADVSEQPLRANVRRLTEALETLGAPLALPVRERLARETGVEAIQKILDEQCLFFVEINPELRVKVRRGRAPAELQQFAFVPFIVKIDNRGAAGQALEITSPQAGPVYAGAALPILERQQQTGLLKNANAANDPGRFLEVEMFSAQPMEAHLSGLEVEYAIALISSSEAGQREATIGFNIGPGTEDIGFRAETAVLFDTKPALPVKLSILDHDGTPTVASLTIRDERGRIYPPQAKRLAPDLFFQPQVYRADGATVLLPPGRFEVTCGRGPEYRESKMALVVGTNEPTEFAVRLERWIDPARFGFYAGDHHIHAAGCSHYEIPTQGITPLDMFMQVKGEGLHVGCVLTWGPCYDFQRRFFSPTTAEISEPLTILKYDLEVSGFGSQALGHVCLLNLKDQTYPGSDGTKSKGWPTWTAPVMRWAKEQGGVTGYPHSDLQVDPRGGARWQLRRHDRNGDSQLSREEAAEVLLPEPFEAIDKDTDRQLTEEELSGSAERASHQLPNLVLPSMRGAGAMEIFVSTAEGVCDFISAMNTGRVGEWNTWYHIMNAGFPLKVSGETDFPCMSSRRVGAGRVYANLGPERRSRIDFADWCAALGQGRSYVSDGYAHALSFEVNGAEPGFGNVALEAPGKVRVRAKVAFAAEQPKSVAQGSLEAPGGRRNAGDTVVLHGPRSDETVRGGERVVEIVINGKAAASRSIPADGKTHELAFEIEVERSSWIALRQFPQLHTNPVDVHVAGKPIRASRASAQWCAEAIELLWENRSRFIAEAERPAARAAYDRATAEYRARAAAAAE